MLVFEERGKPQYPQENLSERTYNELSPHICNCRIKKAGYDKLVQLDVSGMYLCSEIIVHFFFVKSVPILI